MADNCKFNCRSVDHQLHRNCCSMTLLGDEQNYSVNSELEAYTAGLVIFLGHKQTLPLCNVCP